MKLAGGQGWAAYYDRALAACPAYAPAHYNRGVAAAEAGDAEGALAHYAAAVALEPRYAEAHCNAGVLHKAAVRWLGSSTHACMQPAAAGGRRGRSEMQALASSAGRPCWRRGAEAQSPEHGGQG